MDITKSQLSISHLKMISQLAKSGTVKEAADALFITQPALTNRIREAERRLNASLFYRRGRNIVMTNSGKRLLVSATKILDELNRAEHDISRMNQGVEQVLRVSLPHYASFGWLPQLLEGFSENFPEIELEFTSQSPIKPLSSLYANDVDMALTSSATSMLVPESQAFVARRLVEDELVACLSTAHAKCQYKYLKPEDFRDETYVTNSTVPEKDREFELFFQPAGIVPRKVLQVGFNEAIFELIKANQGISIFTRRQFEKYQATLADKSIKLLPLKENGLPLYWHLVYADQTSNLEAARLFRQLFAKYVESKG